ncbi:hypothetical protein BRADI_3g33993v3 [Brachypodium distachyon]|uniref:Uncharacterized protein n=1 Tax=Brachypodium distachyon TaxID=15368 RepID=A0A2K2D0Z1_BRADI|nr:hypothetical protein BRADI_3g33993v3 [Brachypodium distachyon]
MSSNLALHGCLIFLFYYTISFEPSDNNEDPPTNHPRQANFLIVRVKHQGVI